MHSAAHTDTSAGFTRLGLGLAAILILGACSGPIGPNSVIATGTDRGSDKGPLKDGEAAIAYDPDGCQVWIIDDGLEGYSSPRFDPSTGLPICDGRYPPGTVIGKYETTKAGIGDWISGPGRKVVVR